jgi:hypothetical protein
LTGKFGFDSRSIQAQKLCKYEIHAAELDAWTQKCCRRVTNALVVFIGKLDASGQESSYGFCPALSPIHSLWSQPVQCLSALRDRLTSEMASSPILGSPEYGLRMAGAKAALTLMGARAISGQSGRVLSLSLAANHGPSPGPMTTGVRRSSRCFAGTWRSE